MNTTELVPSISIANLVNVRDGVIAKFNAAFDLLAEAQELADTQNLAVPTVIVREHISTNLAEPSVTGHYPRMDDARTIAKLKVDSSAWKLLMSESGMLTFMDAESRKRWSEQLYGADVPVLSAGNIEATFTKLHDSRGEMFDEGVINCFKNLSYNYKTNQHVKFGKRIIINNLFNHYFHSFDRLDDLIRVFHVMDGRPEPDHRNGMYSVIHDEKNKGESEAENDYIHVRWFKKGSAHVTFKRPDLVEKMNKILAKHFPNALPSPSR